MYWQWGHRRKGRLLGLDFALRAPLPDFLPFDDFFSIEQS
jgi:hypothetical protein